MVQPTSSSKQQGRLLDGMDLPLVLVYVAFFVYVVNLTILYQKSSLILMTHSMGLSMTMIVKNQRRTEQPCH